MFETLFRNTLSGWQWSLMALVPLAIIALYFLKLKRQPLEVPSTFLWRRTIEDLHVNSLIQRLRRSLLLFLQLLAVAVAALAQLASPRKTPQAATWKEESAAKGTTPIPSLPSSGSI